MLLMSGKNHRCLRQQRIVMERWVFEYLGFGSDLELTLGFLSFFFEFLDDFSKWSINTKEFRKIIQNGK